ncbi:dynamin family protein [Dactylosporangium sp. AC04546]|uniref:dynamin family protein n=1 Tax=Dactylosporangium sp. AC04546 TaxID=2862460 RepID=UPI001EE07ACB|nr:dynamin family protein [Dactylosporangium sp. AC04546]WVK86780.1 dynamin family protein [Dactylosporangium sp. AC04546]
MWTWERLRSGPEIDQLAAATHQLRAVAVDAGVDLTHRPLLRDTGFADRLRSRLDAPVTLTVVGQVSAGKSSFLNSLFGRRLLPTSGRPTDGVVSVLTYAPNTAAERAERVLLDGSVVGFGSIDEGRRFVDRAHTSAAEHIRTREVRFHLHDPVLNGVRFVNTPGLGDSLEQFERAALDYLHEDESDLIVWLFFPDAAANREELATFTAALARRRDAVLGIVTRTLDGRADDPAFDPHADPDLLAVVAEIRAQLGVYLHDVILYDCPVARDLNHRLRSDPALAQDPAFAEEAARCGATQVDVALGNAARRPGARVASILGRCRSTVDQLLEDAEDIETALTANAASWSERQRAWLAVMRDVVAPARTRLEGDLSAVADTFGKEMAEALGSVTADVLSDDFKLGRVLLNRAGTLLHVARPLGEVLTERITKELTVHLERDDFDRRLQREYLRRVEACLYDLQAELEVAGTPEAGRPEAVRRDVGTVRGATRMVDKGLYAALGRVVTALVGQVTAALAKASAKAATEVVADTVAAPVATAVAGAATAATTEAVAASTAQAAKAGAKAGAAAAVGRVLTVATLVMVPFDIRKFISDFEEGQESLITSLRARFLAEQSRYARQISNQLHTLVDGVFDELSSVLRDTLAPDEAARAGLADRLRRVEAARRDLTALAAAFGATVR